MDFSSLMRDPSYPGWEEDVLRAAECHTNDYRRERLRQMVEKKQCAFDGDRSHPRLVALDKLMLSYKGWELDKANAEKFHFEWEDDVGFHDLLKGMENKQRDKSHPQLIELSKLSLSYPSWAEDYEKAQEAHYAGNDYRFKRITKKMKKKQRAHDGDRSHPRLVALDSIKNSSNSFYPGWEKDMLKAENVHFDWDDDDDEFWTIYNSIKMKQDAFRNDRSHPNLAQLDRIRRSLTYQGWERDFKNCEEEHCKHLYGGGGDQSSSSQFQRLYQKLKKKQKVYGKGDRSHKHLRALDELKLALTYDGWEVDYQQTEQLHFDTVGNEFWEYFRIMVDKQHLHDREEKMKELFSRSQQPRPQTA